MKAHAKAAAWALAAFLALTAAGWFFSLSERTRGTASLHELLEDRDSVLVCALDGRGSAAELCEGYHYELLRQLCRAERLPCRILAYNHGENGPDSLRAGRIRLLVRADTSGCRGLHRTSVHALGASWLTAPDDKAFAHALTRASLPFRHGEAGKNLLRRFERKSGRTGSAGRTPYDSLFLRYAPGGRLDAALLAAVAWKESRFHIETESSAGAVGLMQMRPGTARRFGAEDLLDPEESIAAGARYLSYLYGYFKPYSASEDDALSLTLAAYNAGEGRIMDCIRLARALGEDRIRWDILSEEVIPMMHEEEEMLEEESVRLGAFDGSETRYFVSAVTEKAASWRPFSGCAPSGQDPPAK